MFCTRSSFDFFWRGHPIRIDKHFFTSKRNKPSSNAKQAAFETVQETREIYHFKSMDEVIQMFLL